MLKQLYRDFRLGITEWRWWLLIPIGMSLSLGWGFLIYTCCLLVLSGKDVRKQEHISLLERELEILEGDYIELNMRLERYEP